MNNKDNKENPKNWLVSKVRSGWIILAAGIMVGVAGALIEWQLGSPTYNFRLITGLGMILISVGIAKIIRNRIALKDEQSARRLHVEQHDERTVFIRNRAGNRAFWASTLLIYLCLMWVSLADNGSLPALNNDALWYILAGCVVIPFGVYIISMLVDERRL